MSMFTASPLCMLSPTPLPYRQYLLTDISNIVQVYPQLRVILLFNSRCLNKGLLPTGCFI